MPILKILKENQVVNVNMSARKLILSFASKVTNLAWIQSMLYLFMQ